MCRARSWAVLRLLQPTEVMNHLLLLQFHIFCGQLVSVWFCAKNTIFSWVQFSDSAERRFDCLRRRAGSVHTLTIIYESMSSDGGKLLGPSERLMIRRDRCGILVPSYAMQMLLHRLRRLRICLPTFLAS